MAGFYYFITSVIAGLISNAITIYFQKVQKMDLGIVVLYVYVGVMFLIGIFAFKHYRKTSSKIKTIEEITVLSKIKKLHSSLLRYASHPEQLRIISPEGKDLVGMHAGGPLWREIADAICKGMELKHLRYSNIGTAYHLCDIENGKDIEIPTDNRIESKIEESGLRNGQILAVVENA
jgi:hypothetical protein